MKEMLPSPEHIPGGYRREPSHTGLVIDRDVLVPMRDGVRLCVDVHRPETDEPLPALLAFAIYNKEIQTPEATAALPPQPAWSPLWTGPQEAGDTRFLVARGYVHVIGMPRGVGKSEGGGSREFDSYDLIEWIAQQPWCDGNVGMIGISGFGAEQVHVARQNPPSLKAIFPFDPRGAYGTLGGFREEYPGGVVHLFRYLVGHFGVFHQDRGAPGELPPEKEALWREAMEDPDYRMYPHVHNVVSMKGQHMPAWFEMLIDPFEQPGTRRAQRGGVRADPRSRPTRDRAGTATRTRRTSRAPRRTGGTCATSTRSCCSLGPAHLERPFHGLHHEILRWYDHWLKGIDTGVLDEPPVRFWVMRRERVAHRRRTGRCPRRSGRSSTCRAGSACAPSPSRPSRPTTASRPTRSSRCRSSQTRDVAGLRFLSDPLPHDVLVAGPSVLNLWASIDQDGHELDRDPQGRGARPVGADRARGGVGGAGDLPERELTRGWLKASNRALDPERSTEWKPFHRLTREAAQPVVPGEVTEYRIEILATANLFKAGHRICLEITSMDRPTGVAGATNVEYVPYHVCSSRTTLHHIHHDTEHPSHLLLPVIPEDAA